MEYYYRYTEEIIKNKLKSSGAILLSGPKFCGKTTTCTRFSKSSIRLNTKNVINTIKMNPKGALVGECPRLIDEWQMVPDIFNQVKNDLDINYISGKYILTGSSTPADKTEIYHTGAGRITNIKMKPMSLFESRESKGIISLKDIYEGKNIDIFDLNEEWQLHNTAFVLCRGGWPLSVISDSEVALDITKNYYGNLFNFNETGEINFRNKKREIFNMIVKSYARNISTEASIKTMIDDVKQSEERTMDVKTFNDYKEALEDLFIIEDLESFSPNLRSKTSIRQTPTRHFVDTSIATTALSITPDDLLNDLKTFGLFFEDFAIRDLKIYSELLGAKVMHYRDNAGLECDAIIKFPDSKFAAVEIKLGGDNLINSGIKSLNLFEKKMGNLSDLPPLSFKMIITATGSYQKIDNNIYIVPINMLKA